MIHIHLHTAALTGLGAGADADPDAGLGATLEPVARVEGIGPRATEVITRWLTDLAPGTSVRVTPVVDLNNRTAVDAYEAPDWLRHLIEERDLGCAFLWCGRRGRYDLDHITPYLPPEDGGPPGQTNPENLARLCRFHHRVKTRPGHHGTWDYRRDPGGTLVWTSPLGRGYAVDHTGTLPRS